MDSDGGSVKKLADGAAPAISPDGRTLCYQSAQSVTWMIPAAGGTPKKVAGRMSGAFAFNPQSSRFAYAYWKPEGDRETPHVAVIAISGEVVADIPGSFGFNLHWNPKGDALTFIRQVGGADNILNKSLDNAPPTQITHFRKGVIASYGWTSDGKLVMARGETRADTVLISNFH